MSGVGKYKYHVIQFLEVPSKDIAEFVCVPRSWIHSYGADVPLVKVTYPVEEPSLTEKRVMNRKKKSDCWNSFVSVLRYSTDNYESAKLYIQQELNYSKKSQKDLNGDAKNIPDRTNKSKKKNGDHTLLSAKANEKTSISTQFAMRSAQMNIMEALELTPASNINNKSTNTTTLKRNALPDTDKENHNKRFRVNELVEYDNQVAGPSSEALDCSNKLNLPPSPDDSDRDLCTQETQVKDLNGNTKEVRPTVNQISSKTTNSLDPKIIAQLASSPMFAKWCMLMHELQEVFDNSEFRELINKLFNTDNDCNAPQNNDPIPSASSSTAVAPKFNTEKKKQRLLEEKKSDKDEPIKKKSCPKLFIKTVLPPINYTNHTEDSDFNEDDDGSITLASSNTTVAPKFNTEKSNEKLLEEKNTEDDTDQPLKKISCPNLIIKTVVPPINYANQSEDCDFNDDDDGSDHDGDGDDDDDDDDSDDDYQPKNYSFPERIEKRVLSPVCDANNSEEIDLDLDLDYDFEEDDDYQPLRKLPREYNANNSRWTLNYPKLSEIPSLIELMPHSRVFVSPHEMSTFKRFPKHKRTVPLIKKLLNAVFDKTALMFCSLPGTRAKPIDRDGTIIRPELDRHALKVIINYVTDHVKKEGLPHVGTLSILNILRSEMKRIKRERKIITSRE